MLHFVRPGPQVHRGAWGGVGGEDKGTVMVLDSRRAT